MAGKITIRRYGRWWAVYDGEQLVAVTVYRKGAIEVATRLMGKT